MDRGLVKQFVKHKVFLKYALTGTAVTLLELWLLVVLVEYAGWNKVVASSFAFGLGLIMSFFLRKFYVFKNDDWREVLKQFGLYSFVLVINTALNAVVMHVWCEWWNFHYLMGQVVSNIFLGFISFTFNRAYTFKNISKATINVPKEMANIKAEIKNK